MGEFQLKANQYSVDPEASHEVVTVRIRSFGKVMFSQVCVCSHGCGVPTPGGCLPHMVSKRAVRILLECFLAKK